MAMVISHNIPALTTYNTVNRTNAALEKSIQKLSTGLRINSAADDAAGLAISEKMRSQINGMDRAVSNAQDGISMIQTAEGALNETHSILQRMRELSVQAANDTLTSQDRSYIQLEIDALRDEVTRIGNTTQFNKKKLLNGDAAVLWSSSDLSTKAIVNGGLRSIDQFGQKVTTEGNYKINIKAEAGQSEVQKSDIFKIKHENVVMNKNVNSNTGTTDVEVQSVPAGSYTIEGAAAAKKNVVTGTYGIESFYFAKSEGADDWATAKAKTTTELATNGASSQNTDKENIGKTFKIEDAEGTVVADFKIEDGDTAEKILEKLNKSLKDTASNRDYTINLVIPSDATKKVNLEVVGSKAVELKWSTSADVNAAIKGLVGATLPNASTETIPNVSSMLAFDESKFDGSASVLFEVADVNYTNKTISLKATATVTDLAGNTSTETFEPAVFKEGEAVDLKNFLGDSVKFTLAADNVFGFSKGDKFVYNVTSGTGDFNVTLAGTQNPDWDESWGTNVTDEAVNYSFKDSVAGKDVHLKNYYLNDKTGEAWVGDTILKTNSNFKKDNTENKLLATFDAAYVGQVAKGDVKLRDLDKFWTSEGVFMLDDPKTITLTQGDGSQASVTLYATDTLSDVALKLNDAVANGLGQGKYVDQADHFVTFVDDAAKNSETVEGTFLIRSVVPGESGKISFAGDENVINAFSLNQLQDTRESKYTIEVKDAHTDKIIASGVKVTGNLLKGVVHENVDVTFDSMSGIAATWDDSKKAYVYSKDEKGTNTTLHLSDNTTVFQIGANEGEDMGVHIGDMRAEALGLNKVLVTDRESASRSITILDNAIDKVSTQRAKLGAYQNRLEHTINNLNTASENITAAESRIRDTDMAKEMMNFTKLQIMLQAGTSMLAQANQLPQNVMALVR